MFFVIDFLHYWISLLKKNAQMYEEEIYFGKVLLKQSETVLAYLKAVTWPSDPKFNMVTLHSGWMCGPSLKR